MGILCVSERPSSYKPAVNEDAPHIQRYWTTFASIMQGEWDRILKQTPELRIGEKTEEGIQQQHEFVEGINTQLEPIVRLIFERYDKDGDGKLTADESRAFFDNFVSDHSQFFVLLRIPFETEAFH